MSGPGVDAAHTPDPARASGVKHAGSRLRVRDVLVGVAAWLGAMVLGAVGIRADASFIQYVAAASPLALAIAVRRLAPTAVGIAAGGIALLAVALSGTAGAIAGWLALPSLYTLTRWGRRTVALAVGPAMLALFALVEMMARLGFFRSGWTMAAVTTGFSALMVWGWGLVRRSRGERRADASRRAAAAAREREQLAELAAASERNRIAREMHDIVAHSLSVMIAQADGGLYASRSDPEAGRRALGTIAETGRAALGDMRRIFGFLRHPAEARTGALPAPRPHSQQHEA
ncbi:MAG: histidine kinase dimerization/phosphoacceptor domain-containing protein, partial [Bifidobacteriaceae bacterium]|nr:histidine kinase dimerization/phosphoacceptor domain-containing protein [Bifidobacteriaceae bacterium]